MKLGEMKWLIICLVVCVMREGEAGALKCGPNSEDLQCTLQQGSQDSTGKSKEEEFVRGDTVPHAQAECLAGSEWSSNCHDCRCSHEGVAQCTQRPSCDVPLAEPIRCKPNTTFNRDCNKCTCLENGLGLCTIRYCLTPPIITNPVLPPALAIKECAPGTTWKSYCNNCGCTPEGKHYCTRKACLDQGAAPEIRCAPGSTWRNDCNTCWCTAEGRVLCTKIGCIGMAVMNFDDDLLKNESINIPDLATRSSLNTTKAIVCVANRMFIKDCNTCWCNEDGTSFFCTRKVCVPDLPEENGTEDTPENSTISRKTRAIQEPPKACQPGQEFRMDCNKCLCDNEGQDFSCTRIDCNALNNNNGGTRIKRDMSNKVTTQCTPNSVFQQDCNICRCTHDGGHASCTMKRCEQQPKPNNQANDVNAPLPDSDSTFRCNAGEQFKQDCNDCTCSADGKSVFCTLRLCDQDLTPTI